ncbi:hypothetical protein [Geothrix alkalitolerans]|uniref:hypothetical protein n=1 Tax=Geothrix alkalitolerans TaxID=2922724 RepID=UPI001FB01B49|nr:hypothetical protein [Geothrix alkalitolerans]
MRVTSSLLPAAGLMVLLACGGGGGGTSAPPPPPASAGAFEGPWNGTLVSNTGGSVSATALLLASGEMRYVASNGIQAVGTLSATGSSAAGSGTMYAPTGYVFPGNVASLSYTIHGSGTGGSVLSGTYTSAYDSGTFAFAYNAGAKYASPVVLANVAGTYASTATSSGFPINGRLTSTGALSGSDAFGTLTGTLTAVDPAKNAFRVNVTYTPTGQAGRTYAGLAFFDFSYSPVRLQVQTTGGAGQFAAELQLVGP